MHGMEIHTAVHYGLPVTFVLFDNHAHAMCATREQLFYGDRYSYNRFGPSRLGAGLAAMFPTLPSVDVTDIGELGVAMKAALDVEGPSVVAVECSADEIPPFAPFLGEANPKTADIKEHSTTPRDTLMTLPALEDIAAHRGSTDPIPGLTRIETSPREKATPVIMEMIQVGLPARAGVRRVLHRQRLHRLSSR